MHVQHGASAAFPLILRPLFLAGLARLRMAADRFAERRASLRTRRRAARLSPQLRYDIGEIDGIPPRPRSIDDIQLAYRQSPDWVRVQCP